MEMQDTAVVMDPSGTVRVNMLANLEALFNILANSFELAAMAFGIVLVLVGLFTYHRSISQNPLALHYAGRKAHIGALLIKVGLIVPGLINWLVAACRDAALFN